MRIVSGGLVWDGDGENAFLDALPAAARPDPLTLDEVLIAVLSGRMVWRQWRPSQHQAHQLRQFVGVIGVQTAAGVVLRYIYRRGAQPADGLYAIEQRDTLPAAIAGAVLAATAAQPLPEPPVTANTVPVLVARMVDDGGDEVQGEPRASRNDLERLVAEHLHAFVAGDDSPAPKGAVNRARFYLRLAQRLWQPDTMSAIGQVLALDRLENFNTLALAWREMTPALTYRIGKADIQPPAIVAGSTWMEAILWSMWSIAADAARFFAGLRATNESWGLATKFPQVDAVRADAIAAGLLREARERQAYVASGQFVLALPEHLPWHGAGIAALAIHAQADGLWVAGLTPRSERTASWWWSPEMTTATTLQHTLPASGLAHATLAAFWHDLVVAGDEVIVAAGGRARSPAAPAQPGRKARGAGNPVVVLPRRSIHMTGRREWGTAEDREIVERRSHGVRGHLRELPEGWSRSLEAEGEAREWGFVLPEGYTFVRPHVRGGHDRDPAPVIAKARGLQTLSALL